MKRYRKKPVVIEAVQLDEDNIEAVAEWCEAAAVGDQGVYINTLEGQMRAGFGDWIIRGVKGEFYPCKPDIFAATYEEVA
jgi:hypothetical protein